MQRKELMSLFSILLKLLKELIYTQRFLSDSVLEICALSHSCIYSRLLCASLPSEPDQVLCLCQVTSHARLLRLMGGCRTHCAGNWQLPPVLSLQECPRNMAFVQTQPGSDNKGSADPVYASTLELGKAKLAMLRDYS